MLQSSAWASRNTMSTRQRLISRRSCSRFPMDFTGTPERSESSCCEMPARSARASTYCNGFYVLLLTLNNTSFYDNLRKRWANFSHLKKTLIKIIDYGVDKLVYISCKPTSLARDLEMFLGRGYQVEKVCCVDQFCQTVHVECVTLLQRVK